MPRPSTRRDLKALHRLINETDLVLDSIPDPHPSVASARESLTAALALSSDLLTRSTSEALKSSPAAALGSLGGTATAKRGPEYYARIAGMRANRKGGRPPKKPN